MSHRSYYFILLSSHLFFFFIFFNPIVTSDGISYFWSIHSPIIDGDIDFSNQFNDLPINWFLAKGLELRTPTGLVFNVFPIGSSLLNAPFFLVAHAISIISGYDSDGYSTIYMGAFNMGSVFYSFFGSVFLFHTLTKYFHFRSNDSLLVTLIAVLATPIFVYSFQLSSFSTAHNFFVISLFLSIWMKFRNKNNLRYWIFIGLSTGLIFMVRTVDIVFFIFPLLDLILFKRNEFKKYSKTILYILVSIGCFTIAISPQLIYWEILFGEPIPRPLPLDQWIILHEAYSYRDGFMDWTHPHFAEFFFSEHRGLFTWNPIFLLPLVGYYFLYKKHPQFAILATILTIVIFYLHSAPHSWDGGGSFGQRRIADLTPFFAVGLAALFARFGNQIFSTVLKSIIFSLSILWNILFYLIWKWEHVIRMEPVNFSEHVFSHLSNMWFYIEKEISKSFFIRANQVFFEEQLGLDFDTSISFFILIIPSIVLLLFAIYDYQKK